MTKTLQTYFPFSILLMVFFLAACIKDKAKPTPEIAPLTGCDTVTFSKYIKPIVDTKCAISGCHVGTPGIPDYRTYAVFKDRAEAGRVKIRAIDANATPMPADTKNALTDQQKQLIICWISNGYRE